MMALGIHDLFDGHDFAFFTEGVTDVWPPASHLTTPILSSCRSRDQTLCGPFFRLRSHRVTYIPKGANRVP
jgi:hypothetical protein